MPTPTRDASHESAASSRPAPTGDLSAEEFARWYWLKEELAEFARALGIRTTGGKTLLTERISAKLAGHPFVEPAAATGGRSKQLSGDLTGSTLVPAGQRSSQAVRAWMTAQVGDGFHFDAEMRAFFADSDGTRTLDEAVAHWYATRRQDAREIDAQFEYNRFTRAWHAQHPGGSRRDLLAAWAQYRSLPVEVRGRA